MLLGNLINSCSLSSKWGGGKEHGNTETEDKTKTNITFTYFWSLPIHHRAKQLSSPVLDRTIGVFEVNHCLSPVPLAEMGRKHACRIKACSFSFWDYCRMKAY